MMYMNLNKPIKRGQMPPKKPIFFYPQHPENGTEECHLKNDKKANAFTFAVVPEKPQKALQSLHR